MYAISPKGTSVVFTTNALFDYRLGFRKRSLFVCMIIIYSNNLPILDTGVYALLARDAGCSVCTKPGHPNKKRGHT